MAIATGFARWAHDHSHETATWDMARSAGFVGYVLIWAAVFTGAGSNLRFHPGVGKHAIVWELHRGSATLAIAFVLGHVFGFLLDPFLGFTVFDGLTGFTAAYRPLQLGLGAIALWAMALLIVSTAYSELISKTTWRRIHYLGYVVWVLALLHGLTAGSDTEHWPTHILYTFTASTVAAALFLRFFARPWVDEQVMAHRPVG
jgi:sulfoxide reductase heme-binding subunit YedZ